MSETATKAKIEVETVTMDDGRPVEFSGKKRLNKETFVQGDFLCVRLDFRSGETRQFKCPHGFADPSDPVAKFVLKCAGHGLEQKLGDETSGIADIDDMVEAVDQLMIRLEKGIEGWTQGREGGGSGMAGASVLARALARATDKDIRVVREYLSNVDNKTKMALRADESVAPHIKAIEAERAERAAKRGKATSAVDTASVLASLRSTAQPA